ncbi:hypothetical protein AK812_SmicGene35550 [Symbiodinium microadriaticum]|uniref:Uncharacterized protein n=1 Tax=Symbiodinium microadriaticum TaxID=2951 RepID=A0A1Q9CL79_SYMMI|nr:hypothetical protein AK812_SmicGene35550 [Symbiodinium microadriaticum]
MHKAATPHLSSPRRETSPSAVGSGAQLLFVDKEIGGNAKTLTPGATPIRLDSSCGARPQDVGLEGASCNVNTGTQQSLSSVPYSSEAAGAAGALAGGTPPTPPEPGAIWLSACKDIMTSPRNPLRYNSNAAPDLVLAPGDQIIRVNKVNSNAGAAALSEASTGLGAAGCAVLLLPL